jgi:hypothetical protein
MSENFDFAISHVNEGYIMTIGDDDGVLPNSLDYVNDIINFTKCEAVMSHNAFYSWPLTTNPNKLYWSPFENYEIRLTKDWFHKYLKFDMQYTFDLPSVYCGFVKKDVINRMTKNGKFFHSSTPDAYSAFAVTFAIDKYVYSQKAFVIHGASKNSNGAAYLAKKKDEIGPEAVKFFNENSIPFHNKIVMTKSFRVCSLEALLQFLDKFPDLTNNVQINWKLFLSKVLKERTDFTKEEIESAVLNMCRLHNLNYSDVSSYSESKYLKYFDLTLKEIFRKIFRRLILLLKNRISKIDDTRKFGVYNIHDATILLKTIQDLD